ncbi:MAG: hypothetical protein AB7R77_05985 [Ilumatobacteraceae bacterium]
MARPTMYAGPVGWVDNDADLRKAAAARAQRFEDFKRAKDRELQSVQARLGQNLWKFIPAAQRALDEHVAAGRMVQAAGERVKLAQYDAYVQKLKGMEKALLEEVRKLAKMKLKDWDEG